MWMQINQAWSALDSREQKLLKALGVFLVVVILYMLIWSPIVSNKQIAQQQLQSAQQEWQWLNNQIPAIQKLPANALNANLKITSQTQLMTQLQSSLKQQNLFKDIKTLQSIENGGKVAFDKVDAARLFKWLSLLEQKGVATNRLQASWLEPGFVKAEMQFTLN
ncbi:hypothetical protein THMIRHAM_21060 [Thiomicrorhabdus immobilis]|uniref:Type II secretion system protein M n=1 Tax=Thiomicrorhabdus immobilis TaxID=2791037 RepID=A0ABM7MFU1_9GAMM|nr:type II secretion system protein GspM [Thiomicrorhabdus immobilis]BCN94321.1 hypothetical protein THMIRHAM_21060 [Thiomicrorhabdus immobilis]